jgi:hypothetical protein
VIFHCSGVLGQEPEICAWWPATVRERIAWQRGFSSNTLQKRPEFARRSALTAFRGGVSVQIKKSTASPFSVDEFLREVLVLYEKT